MMNNGLAPVSWRVEGLGATAGRAIRLRSLAMHQRRANCSGGGRACTTLRESSALPGLGISAGRNEYRRCAIWARCRYERRIVEQPGLASTRALERGTFPSMPKTIGNFIIFSEV
jgi:hypothetical protein